MTAALRKAPLVTGLSPNQAVPGSLLTIRGENLGLNASDLAGLTICGVDCLMTAQWESSRKIMARCGPVRAGEKVEGEVLVTTKSGGRGSCTITFRVMTVFVGLLEESNIWIDESRMLPSRFHLDGPVAAVNQMDSDPLGIAPERNPEKITEPMLNSLFPGGAFCSGVEHNRL